MATLYYASQYFTTTLSVVGGIDASQTTDIVLQSVTGIDDTTKPGIALINYSNPLNESIAEWVTFTSINSTTKELQGVTRGAEKGSAKTHSNGVTVAFPISESHINNIADRLTGVDTTLASDTNGNELIKTSTTASAVNEITVTNAATGNAPEISATGGDTNIDLKLKGKGTGTVEIYNPTSTAYEAAVGETGWIPAGETWTYSAWDDTNGVSTATITVPSDATAKYQAGMRIKFTQSTGGTKFGIITSVPSTTSIVAFINTDYQLENEAITAPFYSPLNTPFGFVNDPNKYKVEHTDDVDDTDGTVSSTWENTGSHSIDIPVGSWKTFYDVCLQVRKDSAGVIFAGATLSTTNNSESDVSMTSSIAGESIVRLRSVLHREQIYTLTTKDTYYLNFNSPSGGDDIDLANADSRLIIRAICAYL